MTRTVPKNLDVATKTDEAPSPGAITQNDHHHNRTLTSAKTMEFIKNEFLREPDTEDRMKERAKQRGVITFLVLDGEKDFALKTAKDYGLTDAEIKSAMMAAIECFVDRGDISAALLTAADIKLTEQELSTIVISHYKLKLSESKQ